MRARARNDATVVHYERARLLRPDGAEILNNLGNALAALGRHDEAVVRYELAIVLTPDLATLHHNLATALEVLHRTHEALIHYERALALKPDLTDAQLGISNVLREFGRFDEAHRAFEAVIESNPGKIAAYYRLSVSKRFAPEDPRLAALETFAREPASLSDDDRMYLHFALSKAHDDLGRHERSFAHLVEGNRMKRRQFAYGEANALGFMDRCCDFLTPDHFRKKAGRGNPSQAPAFIVGMMRSGSTLAEQILASRPQIFGGGERPHFEKSPIATPQGAGVRHTPSYLAATRALGDPWIGVLAAHYLQALTTAAPAAPRITDKLLGNFINVSSSMLVSNRPTLVRFCARIPSDHSRNDGCLLEPLGCGGGSATDFGQVVAIRAFDALDHPEVEQPA
jgi:tetratricopeptide (TPR) repeat protein